MEAFGYEQSNKKSYKPLKLREVTLRCNENELNKIIELLQSVRNDIQNTEDIEDGEHWHYRDYNELWTENESDLIIYLDKNF